MTTLTRMAPAQWRVLNWLHDAATFGGRPARSIHAAMKLQNADAADIVALEERRLVEAHIGDIPISFAEQFGGRAILTATVATTLRLTGAGGRVADDPHNRAIRILYRRSGIGGAQRVAMIKHDALVDDQALKELDDAGLIQASQANIPLTTFRKLPHDLLLRLTPRGRRYAPRGAA